MIKWNATRAETLTISKITQRALEFGIERDRMSIHMDLEAAHCNGCPLDLERLLSFPPFDFVHDVCGIANHINRETGKLGDCFLPRCAARQ